jgi:hypothetical protein
MWKLKFTDSVFSIMLYRGLITVTTPKIDLFAFEFVYSNRFYKEFWILLGELLKQPPNLVLKFYLHTWSKPFKIYLKLHRIHINQIMRKHFSLGKRISTITEITKSEFKQRFSE